MRGKITRVLAILVVLVMAVALMPAQTAWADYAPGQECPFCHGSILILMDVTETQHAFVCNNNACEYSRGSWYYEDHWGGEATCTKRAQCEGCKDTPNHGTEYGKVNPDNHVNIVDDTAVAATCTEAGKTAGKHCGDCGKVIEEQTEVKALGHSWGAWTVTKEATTTEEGVETRVCKNDSTHTETRKIAKKEETKEEETKKEEPKKEAAKTETVSKTTDTQPQTGDESQTVWVIMMMLSAAILIVLAIRKRRVFD